MIFDPDEFIKSAQAAQAPTQPEQPKGFDPDAFIKEQGGEAITDPAPQFNYESMRYFQGTKELNNVFTPEQKEAFDNLDKVIPSTESKEAARTRLVSQDFAQSTLPGMPPNYLNNNWGAVKEGYLTRFNDHTKNPSDEYFYKFLGDLGEQVNYVKNYKPQSSPKPEPWKWDEKATMIGALKYAASQIFLHGLSDVPYHELPEAKKEDFPDETTIVDTENGPVAVNPSVVAGVYNGLRPFLSQFTTVKGGLNIITGEELVTGGAEIAKTSQVGKYILTTANWGFAASMGYSFGSKAKERYDIITDSKRRLSERVAAGVEGVTELSMTTGAILAGVHSFMKPQDYENFIKVVQKDPVEGANILREKAELTDTPGAKPTLNNAADHLEELDKDARSVSQPKPRIRVTRDAEGNVIARPLTPEEEQQAIERNRPDQTPIQNEVTPVIDKVPEHQNITLDDLITKPDGAIGLNNESMKTLFEQQGLEQPSEEEKVNFENEFDKTVKGIEGGSINTTDVINGILEKGSPPNLYENSVLLYETRRLNNETIRINNELKNAEAAGDEQMASMLQNQLNTARDNLAKIGQINKSTGADAAISFAFRKLMIKEDYSVASIQRKFEQATGRSPTPEEFKEIADLSDKIFQASDELDKETKKRADVDTEETLARKKDRLLKQIDDLKERLSGKKPATKPKRLERPEIEEIEKLSQERDRLSDDLKIRNSRNERIKKLEEEISAKRKQIVEKDLAVEGQKLSRPEQKDLEPLLQKREELNAKLARLRKEAKFEAEGSNVQLQVDKVNKQIEDIKAKIAEGDLLPKPKAVDRPAIKEVEKAKQELDELQKQYAEAKKQAVEEEKARIEKLGLKPEESAEDLIKKRANELDRKIEQKKKVLERFGVTTKAELLNRPLPEILEEKTRQLEDLNRQISEKVTKRGQDVGERIQKRTEELQKKLESEDFTKEQRKEYKLTPEQQLAQDRLNNLKRLVDNKIYEQEFKAKPFIKKAQTYLKDWAVFRFISSPFVILKLLGANAYRLGITPLENLGVILPSKILTKLAGEKAVRGSETVPSFGAWSRSEARALSATLLKSFPDFFNALMGRNNEIETALGELKMDKGLNKYVGRLHQALQSPLRRNDYARRFMLLNEQDMALGADMRNPVKQVLNMHETWMDSNRARLMQENQVAKGWNALIKTLESEKADSKFAKFIATSLRIDSPIVRIPINAVSELNSYLFGILDPVSTLIFKGFDGFKDLNTAQMQNMIRNIKKGQVGLALGALAFFKPDLVKYGTPLKKGEKRPMSEPQPGEMKIGNTVIPARLMDHPLMGEIQVWAETRNILNDLVKLDKIHDKTPVDHIVARMLEGGEAFSRSYLEKLKDIPGIKDTLLAGMADPNKSERVTAALIANLLVPELSAQAAQVLDKKQPFNLRERPTPRGTTGRVGPLQETKEAIQERIPGLRQRLPKRNVDVSLIGD